MRSPARTITTILLLAILVACGVALLYFGTSTGMGFGSGTTVTGQATAKAPFYAQAGWIRNNSPWPVDITQITANDAHTAKKTVVYLNRDQSDVEVKSGTTPFWATTAATYPYTLAGGGLRYLAFAISPEQDKVASFSSITVDFRGPLGFTFSRTFSGVQVAASSATLAGGILAADPADDTDSLDNYIDLLRSALAHNDNNRLAQVMGGGATPKQASKFDAAEAAFKATYPVAATHPNDDPYTVDLVFYRSDPAKNGLKPIRVVWSGFRWSVTKF